ncbi:MAG: MOSC domain-containing protein YiiM [Nitriliruptoraceae bacterium]|jgi:MOSC domain-containing protein YiiM
MPQITATCITLRPAANGPDNDRPSGIDKGPVDEVELTPWGVADDQVHDTAHHGGRGKAAYAYADEDAAWWSERIGEDVPAGRFGENLRTSGVDHAGSVIGSCWRIGASVEVEVSMPRVPCGTFRHHMGDRVGWVKEFARANRTGIYLRVRAGGIVRPGDSLTIVEVPDHGVTIGSWFARATADDGRALLAAEANGWSMDPDLRAEIETVLATS